MDRVGERSPASLRQRACRACCAATCLAPASCSGGEGAAGADATSECLQASIAMEFTSFNTQAEEVRVRMASMGRPSRRLLLLCCSAAAVVLYYDACLGNVPAPIVHVPAAMC